MVDYAGTRWRNISYGTGRLSEPIASPGSNAHHRGEIMPDTPIDYLHFAGGVGRGKGKKIVLLAGNDEYRSEKSR
jgi:hypothetical protein